MKASHKTLANWYLQLSQQTEAGIALAEALVLSKGPRESDRLRMAEALSLGTSVAVMLQKAPKWLPIADRAFIAAAAETGKLPETFHSLHRRHEQMHKTQMKIVLASLYPMGVFHIGVFLLPILRMIDFEVGFLWDPYLYGTQVAAILIPVWAIIALMVFMAKTDSPLLPRILRCIPFLRKFSKSQALADFSLSLGSLIEAGVPIQAAWQCAANLTNDAGIKKANRQLEPTFANGQNPADTLQRFKCFPEDFKAFYKTGANSGQLDHTLQKAGQIYQDKANNALTLAAVFYPSLLFFCVAGFVVYTIFTFYGGYLEIFDSLDE